MAHQHNDRPDESELWEKISASTGMERADALVDLSHIAYDRGDFKEALALCESARDIFIEMGGNAYDSRLAHVYDGMMWCHTKLERREEGAMVAELAAALLVEDEPEKYADALRNAGCYWYNAKNYEKALEYHSKALALAYVEKSEYDSAIDNHNIAMCLQKMDRHQEAIEYLLKARELAKIAKKIENVASSDFLITDSYIKLENGIEAVHHAQKALDYYELVQEQSSHAWALYGLGSAKLLVDEREAAMELFEDCKNMAITMRNRDWDLIIQIENEIADMLEEDGEAEKAARIRARINTIEETYLDEKAAK